MTVHIWCPRPSESAVLLRDGLRAAGVECRKTKVNLKRRRRFEEEVDQDTDLWINWGPAAIVHTKPRLVALNTVHPAISKRTQLITLYNGGVLVPEVFQRPGPGRIGRSFSHQGGSDLLTDTGRDYYTQRLQLTTEYRVHVFDGLSIRAGVKIPRTGVATPHAWVRSWEGGWRVSYGSVKVPDAVRSLAKKAVAVLKLDFGAVDLGVCNGQPVVLEVNTAPGLEGGTVEAYVRAVQRRLNQGR